jgi:DnaK suppressor protein
MLLEQRQSVLREVEDLLRRRREDQTRQWEESVPDAADMARKDDSGERDLALLESRNRVRQQYDDALARLDEGRYGLCDDCGRQIGEARLKAVPFAKRCVDCQNKAESIDQLEHAAERRSI